MKNLQKFENFNEEMLEFNLTETQKQEISNLFEKVMDKYSKIGNRDLNNPNSMYFSGVADGINHCVKMINGITDDYLDDVK